MSIILHIYQIIGEGGEAVTDNELRGEFAAIREQYQAMTARMERFEARMENLEKGQADLRQEFRPRFEGLESRLASGLAGKASTASLGIQTAILVAVMT